VAEARDCYSARKERGRCFLHAPEAYLLPPSRPNSVLKISSHPPPLGRSLGVRMSRTMWLALFCLVGLGAAIAITVAARPPSLVVDAAQDQSKIELPFALNESAKSDRLELPDARAETEIIVPAAKTMLAETPLTSPETVKKAADRHWEDANARISSVASPRRYTKSKESKKSAGKYPPNERADIWHCRKDAMGSLLRSLDLSPRCNL
jgi:hypothetical protein